MLHGHSGAGASAYPTISVSVASGPANGDLALLTGFLVCSLESQAVDSLAITSWQFIMDSLGAGCQGFPSERNCLIGGKAVNVLCRHTSTKEEYEGKLNPM
mmetsp:Transcript_84595/g.149749  ORF Transcript_84595/g.149749 Transcript_84595/m.149749 type:complete len:101 (-) Transcript_84595:173-475(-)